MVRTKQRRKIHSKKGQVSLSDIPNAVLILGLAAVVGVIMLILVGDVKDSGGEDVCTIDGKQYNSTADECFNTNGSNYVNVTEPTLLNASGSAESGIGEVFENFDLIGLMIGLGVVLVILLGVFAFIGARRTNLF